MLIALSILLAVPPAGQAVITVHDGESLGYESMYIYQYVNILEGGRLIFEDVIFQRNDYLCTISDCANLDNHGIFTADDTLQILLGSTTYGKGSVKNYYIINNWLFVESSG